MESVDSFFGNTFATQDITFDEARTVIHQAFVGKDKTPAEPILAFLIEPSARSMTQVDLNLPVTFLIGVAVYELIHVFNCTYIGERDKESGNLMSCMLVREYDPHQKPSWFLGLKSAWSAFSCFLQMRRSGGGAVPGLCLFTDSKYKTLELKLQAENFDKNTQIWHKEHGPAEKHLYVCMLGVHPDHQGKGLGSKIMESLNDLADSKSMKCYLECSGAKNIAFYEKCGYTTYADEVLTDPTDKSRFIDGKVMIRQPRPRSS